MQPGVRAGWRSPTAASVTLVVDHAALFAARSLLGGADCPAPAPASVSPAAGWRSAGAVLAALGVFAAGVPASATSTVTPAGRRHVLYHGRRVAGYRHRTTHLMPRRWFAAGISSRVGLITARRNELRVALVN